MKNSESFYKDLFKNNQEIMLLINPQTSIIEDCNIAACNFYGYSYDEILKLKITNINMITEDQIFKEINLARTHKKNYFYFKHRLSSGEVRDVEVRSTPLKIDKNDYILYIVTDTLDTDKGKIDSLMLEKTVSERTYKLEEANNLNSAILESSPEIIVFALDSNYCYLTFNSKHKKIMKAIWGKEIEKGMNMLEIIGRNDDREKAKMNFNRALSGESFTAIEEYGDEGLSRLYWQDFWAPILSKTGKVIGLTCFVQDVTERIKIEKELKESENLYRTFIDASNDMIYLKDEQFRHIVVNKSLADFFGKTIENIIGKSDFELMNKTSAEKCREIDIAALSAKSACIAEEVIGNKVYETLKFPVTLMNNKIGVGGYIRDITNRKKAEEELIYLSYHDYLTGLYNRRYFEEEFERRVKRANFPIALLVGNIDDFKTFNDLHGHVKGDEVLKEIANKIKELTIDGGVLARVGGDEFAILVSGKNEAEIRQCLDKLTKEFDEELEESGKDVLITISWGYGIKRDEKDTLDDILVEAEAFMNNRKIYNQNSLRSKTIDVIMETLFTKSEREKKHSERVGKHCEAIARRMNMTKPEVDKIRVAGLLHDIGKIGIEETILNKAGKLDSKEWEQMRLHPEKGSLILEKTNEYSDIAEIVLSHHERYDGKGYPNGLAGSAIPLMARIVAVSDAYDAMTEQRTYRTPLSKEEAIAELKKCSGTQFDPKVVTAFINMVMEI